ncbi:hypothetical protein RJ639_040502 [Escallonia herrerae]|uniref:Glycosyltransferase n=1 Tax=Escallonia herrerae TaxID=1293975 RepID=A0AA88WEL0_9ASTE|nr:hypothetical protein RJ639_040502 [Escallonia herrerae]
MSTTMACNQSQPHVALLPSAGMGHLTPFLRLAAMLASRSCTVTLITIQPTISEAESTHITSFFATHPLSTVSISMSILLRLQMPPPTIHSLFSLEPLVAPVIFWVLSYVLYLHLSLPSSLTSLSPPVLVRFYSLMACLPYLSLENHAKTGGSENDVEIPETITAQNNGKVLTNLPPVLPIGPYEPYELKQGHHIPWLDDQPAESVVYVSFGSRTTMSKDQLRELGNGLERSGYRFLWVLKASKVDKDDKEGIENLLGHSFLERTKNEGIVVKEWVQPEEILAHPAIGGFLSHRGWNSVMEAAQTGVPILAWPQHGDQKVNAEVVEKAELGIWARHWGWGGQKLVKGDEVAGKIIELMGDHILRANAKKVGQEARKATKVGGSSEKVLMEVIELLKPKNGN